MVLVLILSARNSRGEGGYPPFLFFVVTRNMIYTRHSRPMSRFFYWESK
jgi:hypothetical protein